MCAFIYMLKMCVCVCKYKIIKLLLIEHQLRLTNTEEKSEMIMSCAIGHIFTIN